MSDTPLTREQLQANLDVFEQLRSGYIAPHRLGEWGIFDNTNKLLGKLNPEFYALFASQKARQPLGNTGRKRLKRNTIDQIQATTKKLLAEYKDGTE